MTTKPAGIEEATTNSRAAARFARRVVAFSNELRAKALARTPPSVEVQYTIEHQRAALDLAEEELREQVEELTRAMEEAETERRRFRDLFDGTPDGLLLTNRDGAVLEWNRAAEGLLANGVLARKPLASFVDRDDVARFREALLRGRTETRATLATYLKRGDTTRIQVVLEITAVDAGDRLLVRARPTAAKDAACDAVLRIAELERALRDKDDLLARERAERRRLELDRVAVERFVDSLASDLRGGLHSILGWAEMLHGQSLAKASRDRALDTLSRTARSQLALVEAMLDLSQVGAGRLRLEIESVDAAAVVRHVVAELAAAATEAGTTVAYEGEEAVIFGDRRRLGQIATMLLSSAFAGRPKSIAVSVSCEGAHVVLRVAPARATPVDLYVVSHLVDLHGGTLTAEDDAITIRVPARERPLAKEQRLEGCRVLVIEEAGDSRDVIASILSHHGASVSLASDGAEGVSFVSQVSPHVVVCDPAALGSTMLSAFRNADLAAVAIGGREKHALAVGFDLHLPHPLDPVKLVAALRELAFRGGQS